MGFLILLREYSKGFPKNPIRVKLLQEPKSSTCREEDVTLHASDVQNPSNIFAWLKLIRGGRNKEILLSTRSDTRQVIAEWSDGQPRLGGVKHWVSKCCRRGSDWQSGQLEKQPEKG